MQSKASLHKKQRDAKPPATAAVTATAAAAGGGPTPAAAAGSRQTAKQAARAVAAQRAGGRAGGSGSRSGQHQTCTTANSSLGTVLTAAGCLAVLLCAASLRSLQAAGHSGTPPLLANSTSSGSQTDTCAASLPPGTYFVSYTPSYDDTCGGCVVMHFLVDRLNRLYGGAVPVAFVLPEFRNTRVAVNPGYATPYLPPWLSAAGGIGIYPEIIFGNPAGFSRAIRWILYWPGVGGRPPPSFFRPEDLIACYLPCDAIFTPAHTTHDLRLVDLGLEYLMNLNIRPPEQRNGTIVFRGYFGKNVFARPGDTKLVHTVDPKASNTKGAQQGQSQQCRAEVQQPAVAQQAAATEQAAAQQEAAQQAAGGCTAAQQTAAEQAAARLEGPHPEDLERTVGKRERLERFAAAERFVSYDAATWRSVEAALAGAVSVVVPVEGIRREDWVQVPYGGLMKYGVAYGEDDIPRALATQPLLLPALKQEAAKMERDVRVFVARLCRFFNLTCTYEPC